MRDQASLLMQSSILRKLKLIILSRGKGNKLLTFWICILFLAPRYNLANHLMKYVEICALVTRKTES